MGFGGAPGTFPTSLDEIDWFRIPGHEKYGLPMTDFQIDDFGGLWSDSLNQEPGGTGRTEVVDPADWDTGSEYDPTAPVNPGMTGPYVPPSPHTGRGGFGTGEQSAWWQEFSRMFPGWARIASTDAQFYGIMEQYWTDTKDSDWGYQDIYDGLLMSLKQSDWYQLNTQSVRDSLLLEKEDPATWTYSLGVSEEDARELAQIQFGDVGLFSDDFYSDIAEMAERYNWDKDEMRKKIVEKGRSLTHAPNIGAIKRSHDSIQSYARSMLTSIGGKAWDFAYEIGDGVGTMADAKDHIQGLAAQSWDFVDVDDLAERGLTISDLLSGAKGIMADTLELNPADVHLWEMGPNDLVVGEGDSRRFINDQEAENWAKRQSRFMGTDELRSSVRTVSKGITQMFGLRGSEMGYF